MLHTRLFRALRPSSLRLRRFARAPLMERLEARTLLSFLPAVHYDTGPRPLAVAVGDFNGDDRLDLAVANSLALGTVSVLLGRGDGTFQGPVPYSAGRLAASVAVGDLNSDGHADLVVGVGIDPGTVTVLLGQGDGSFQPPIPYGPGGITAVAVEDLNGDGTLDLAATLFPNNRVGVLLGHGDGSFQPAVVYAVGSGPVSVATGDLDGDGFPDLAVANRVSGNVSVLLNAAAAEQPADVAGRSAPGSWPPAPAPDRQATLNPEEAAPQRVADVGWFLAAHLVRDDIGVLRFPVLRETSNLAEALSPVWGELEAALAEVTSGMLFRG